MATGVADAPAMRPLAALGARFLALAGTVGGMGVLFGRILSRTLRLSFDASELLRNLYKMGVKSLPIVIVTALFTVSGRVGANNTAELGTMVVTEQIDALRALAIDPISFLITPRFIGIVVTLFLSTVFADVLALFGAAYAGLGILGVEPQVFYNGLSSGLLGLGDVFHGLIKSIAFGIVIGLASCQFGIATSGGAPGVGRAVNATVVVSATGIFVLDYLISFLIG
jgi:phospholipid/cholesterol/gamma-HCH transport system permease protein